VTHNDQVIGEMASLIREIEERLPLLPSAIAALGTDFHCEGEFEMDILKHLSMFAKMLERRTDWSP
jgi:hypothetical protein